MAKINSIKADQLQKVIDKSVAASGVPQTVQDPATIAAVAVLISAAT